MATFTVTGPYDKSIECAVCLDPWRMPVEVQPCSHVFCAPCLRPGQPCAVCRAAVTDASKRPHRILCELAAAVEVTCDRCRWVGTRELSEAHACAQGAGPADVHAPGQLQMSYSQQQAAARAASSQRPVPQHAPSPPQNMRHAPPPPPPPSAPQNIRFVPPPPGTSAAPPPAPSAPHNIATAEFGATCDTVREVLPHLSAELVGRALKYYRGDATALIEASMTGNMPPHLVEVASPTAAEAPPPPQFADPAQPSPIPASRLLPSAARQGAVPAMAPAAPLPRALSAAQQEQYAVPAAGRVYEIAPRHAPLLRVDCAGAGSARGTPVLMYEATGGSHQRFRAVDAGNGFLSFAPLHAPTTALDCPARGQPCRLWNVSANADAQSWRPEAADAASPGYFRLVRGGAAGLVLDVACASAANGAVLSAFDAQPGAGVANQHFRFLEVQARHFSTLPLPGNVYSIAPRHAGSLRVDAEPGQAAVLRTAGARATQRFAIKGNAGFFSLALAADFSQQLGNAARGRPVAMAPARANDAAQLWRLESAGDGWFSVVQKSDGLALDVDRASTADGAALMTWDLHRTAYNQQFRFVQLE
jgi:hypothetical protein